MKIFERWERTDGIMGQSDGSFIVLLRASISVIHSLITLMLFDTVHFLLFSWF